MMVAHIKNEPANTRFFSTVISIVTCDEACRTMGEFCTHKLSQDVQNDRQLREEGFERA
jgi:hypothetical protein